MPHFTVLVIGENIERQLQPFHEFECTGVDDEFVQEIDLNDKVRTRMTGEEAESLEDALGWYGLENRIVASEEEIDRSGPHKYGYAIVRDGILIKAIGRTNPNKKWDWWNLGGRWHGMLTLKPGRHGSVGEPGLMGSRHGNGGVDQARKGDVDFDAMRNKAGRDAGAQYDTVAKIIAGRSWETFDTVRARHDSIDPARAQYWAQDVLQDWQRSEHYGPFNSIDDFHCGREDYVERARQGAITTFAVLKDGQWYERGFMGWWGSVRDEKDMTAWNREFAALLDGLPDDTLLSVVDCHI